MSHGVGVTSITGAATIKVNSSNGAITLTDVGVFSVAAGTGITTNVTTGSYNVHLGYATIPSNSAVTHEIVIGTNSPTGKGGSTGFISPNGGGVYQGNNSSSWSTTSDQRIKENVKDITGLDIITKLHPVSFDYIETKKADVGFIATAFPINSTAS